MTVCTGIVVQECSLEEDICQSGPRGWSQSGSRGFRNPIGPVELVLSCSGPVYMTKGDDPLATFEPQILRWIVINSFLVNVLK